MALYPLIRPLLFALDAESAHALTLAALSTRPASPHPPADRVLGCRVAGIDFPNPIGLAAGFDKDGRAADGLAGLGFGFVEIGTLTPRPQAGNPRPRLFRLAADRAVVNRMGFNNGGHDAARRRLQKRKSGGIVGINLGANKDSSDRIADYIAGITAMAGVCDYLTVNISSPNTPGLRDLQAATSLDELLAAVMETRGVDGPPLFLKIAPDLAPAEIDSIARVVLDRRIDGLIVGNTTLSRPGLSSRHAAQTGGLSGPPLAPLARQRLADFRRATGGALPLIAAGGIESADDAYARIRAGASLVQLYTALVYEGPGLVGRIASGLRALLERDGFANVVEAVGEA